MKLEAMMQRQMLPKGKKNPLAGQFAARSVHKDLKKLVAKGARKVERHFANVGRNHPDYGLTPAEHWARKAAR